MLTLEQMRAEYSEEESLQDVLDVLGEYGFELGSWQSGAVRPTVIRGMAWFARSAQILARAVSYLIYNSDATGTGLTKLSKDNFDNPRTVAVSTVGVVRLTGGAVGPPYTVQPGGVIVSDGTLTFRNAEGGTIPLSGYVDLSFYCETPGDVGNVPNGAITTMMTTYAGVTCSNPARAGATTWVTTGGKDEEQDAALKARNSAKWSTLSVVESISDRFEYVARKALPNCRVTVDDSNPRGPFTVDVWIAAQDRAATGTERDLVADAVTAERFGSRHSVIAAVEQPIDVAGAIYYVGVLTEVQAAVRQALGAYIDSAPIGGFDLSPGPKHVLLWDAMVDAIRSAPGVQRVVLTTPPTDVTLADFSVAKLYWLGSALTWIEVTA